MSRTSARRHAVIIVTVCCVRGRLRHADGAAGAADGACGIPSSCIPPLPPALANAGAAAQIDRGWRYLQNNDLGNAEREFAAAMKLTPDLSGAGRFRLRRARARRS